ncbi:hypothetical protein Anas_10492 [Armadillidium nasatum]|uniref:C2H2-type domain-containing protein n=1 Tax=Armadillidium nasatum TaxID=96803 RepID=A0A5N5TFC3_9CRUS|nr:hypothetical protein Anas_10492 [Armadillidium nasatum]
MVLVYLLCETELYLEYSIGTLVSIPTVRVVNSLFANICIMEGFTEDAFKCGICNEEKFSIDEYVGHMLEKEECTMVLETSKYLQGMVLPSSNAISLNEVSYSYHLNMKSKMPSFALEMEVSKGVTRWKCRVCPLTFSREAAVINHYKLSHVSIFLNTKVKYEICKHIKQYLKTSHNILLKKFCRILKGLKTLKFYVIRLLSYSKR